MQAGLGCFFILIFAIFFLIAGAIRNILHFLFGIPMGNSRPQNGTRQSYKGTRQGPSRPNSRHRRAQKGKIFGKDEGEYVDFEEIRE